MACWIMAPSHSWRNGDVSWIRPNYIHAKALSEENLKIVWRLWPIVVGDTKWDRVIKIWGIHSHEWRRPPRAHVVTVIYIKKTWNIWHLVKYTPRLPDILGCFVFNVNFLNIDYFYLIRYLMKITLFDDFDMWQNMVVQVLIERI